MVPENLLHPVPEDLRLQHERSEQNDWALILAMMGMLMPKLADRCEQGEMIPLLKRREIQVLLKAGFSVADVAERTATSADTVRRVRKN